jgi:hypothetical protein
VRVDGAIDSLANGRRPSRRGHWRRRIRRACRDTLGLPLRRQPPVLARRAGPRRHGGCGQVGPAGNGVVAAARPPLEPPLTGPVPTDTVSCQGPP